MGDDFMNYIIDFYKGLDILNLIIFWGIIIVIILLLIFSIAIANKNKKLKRIIASKSQTSDDLDELPIAKEPILNLDNIDDSILINETEQVPITNTDNLSEEEQFIAEEHVIEYSNDFPSFDNDQQNDVTKSENQKYEIPIKEPVSELPNAPYQKNVLREMSLGQTSPIGIVKPVQKELKNAKELQDSLLDNEIDSVKVQELKNSSPQKTSTTISNSYLSESAQLRNDDLSEENNQSKNNSTNTNQITQTIKNYNQNQIYSSSPPEKSDYQTIINKEEQSINHLKQLREEKSSLSTKSSEYLTSSQEKYLKEVSDKLSEAKQLEGIDRTEYELKQEEEAIISYEELMRKKDSIQIIDEEDAVISIDELIKRKNRLAKLYNLTEEEENEKFINELKKFRDDL